MPKKLVKKKKAGSIEKSKKPKIFTEKKRVKKISKSVSKDLQGTKGSLDVFWADQIAVDLITRAKKEDVQVVCRGGASPSGGKHIGNMFDLMKGYIICKAVLRKKYPSHVVFTSDDRDPMRAIPAKIPSLDGRMVETKGEIENKIRPFLGMPYTKIPDPFGCCPSWAEHFTRVWLDGIIAIGIEEKYLKTFSNDTLYNEGRFDPYFEIILKNIDLVRTIMKEFQESIPDDYIPIQAICKKCGKITTKVVGFDIEKKTVRYECIDKDLAGKYKIEGCGHKDETSFHDCKLVWRFENPAQVAMFNTLCEPYGKEHAEGTVKSNVEILKQIFKFEPPVMPIYEFLLMNGEKMSSRRGNAYIVQEMLEIMEPEVLSFLYTKRSLEQRNVDIKNIHLLINDFERAEKVYFAKEKVANDNDRITLIRSYESAMRIVPKVMPIRIDYQFAAVVAQLVGGDFEKALHILHSTGHVDQNRKLDNIEKERIRFRLNLAKNWVDRFVPEQRIILNTEFPGYVTKLLTVGQKNALKELAHILGRRIDQHQLYNAFYEICKQHNITTREFFKLMYRILINRESGPRLAPFIIALGRDRVRYLLEEIK
ncbi:MAG: lysine--tRNA ligase [Candidatus Aenigmatarchaeota archaeon]